MSELVQRITADPQICHGKPISRGRRYPVAAMLEYRAAGDSIEELLEEVPDLEREDFLAGMEFANWALKTRSTRVPLTE